LWRFLERDFAQRKTECIVQAPEVIFDVIVLSPEKPAKTERKPTGAADCPTSTKG
jgi:hypothetical protein